MRIGISGQDFHPGNTGGSETYFRDLVEGLPRLNSAENFIVYVPGRFVGNLDYNYPNLKYCLLDFKCELFNRISRKLKIGKKPYKQGIDLLHFPFQRTDVGVVDYPVIVTFHDIQDSYLPKNFSTSELQQRQSINKRAIRESDQIIAISEFTKATLIKKYKVEESKVSVIYHGVDDVYFRQNNVADTNSSKYFYYPAASWPHKNHLRLLKAFKLVLAKYPEYKLILSGARKQESEKIEDFIEKNKMSANVEHLGYVAYQDLPHLYAGAYALIFPSLFEGFGYPVVEAMASGCPVLCSNLTSLPEIGGSAVLYFNPLSEESIFDSIEKIILQPNLRSDMARRGKKQASKFTKEGMIRETFKLYEKVIKDYKK